MKVADGNPEKDGRFEQACWHALKRSQQQSNIFFIISYLNIIEIL